MKQILISLGAIAIMAITPIQAQSLKDLFKKGGSLNKVIENVAEQASTINITGNWQYTGSAIEFETENILLKASGSAAATAIEGKLNSQLEKIGIKEGMLNFTFEADSTFYCNFKDRRAIHGTYSYDPTEKVVHLKYLERVNMDANFSILSGSMKLMFEADRLLQLITDLSAKSKSQALNSISDLTKNYNGMLIGIELKKQDCTSSNEL